MGLSNGYPMGMNPYLVPALKMTPMLIARLFKEFSPGQFDLRPDPDRFTVREATAHLADWEPILRDRIRLAVESPGATIVGMDESERALEQGYASMDPFTCLDSWTAERSKTVDYVSRLGPEDFSKKAVHSERGELTVADLANMIPCHDVYHLDHLVWMLDRSKTIDTW
ncbi:MAG: DinB family protein [Fimbriimonadales bacterium]|nr:DinB family protein [Fimbriimonadales bacterium]